MKFNLAHAQQKAKEAEPHVLPKPCAVCTKVIAAAYGRHMKGDIEEWTCKGKCEHEYTARKLPLDKA